MTEKRFELRLCSNGTYYIWNNNELTDIDFDKFNKESAMTIVDLLNDLSEENEELKKDRFICLDCEHSGYIEIGCLCEKEDCWTEYKSDCENFKEFEE